MEKRKKYTNILTVAACYKGRAYPAYWKVFDRKGNSFFEDWEEIITPVTKGLHQIGWLSGILIHVVADREFAGPKLAEWFKSTCRVGATLRMKAIRYPKGIGDEMSGMKIATLLHGND